MKWSEWAKKWSISDEAIQDLKNFITDNLGDSFDADSGSEMAILQLVKLEASKKGARLWRNNRGATYTQEGNFIRFGLANESKQVNKIIKSSDLIGIKPIKIGKKHLGNTIGCFLSREIKAKNWKYKNTEHEQAQLNWINLINALGGDAAFATGQGTID